MTRRGRREPRPCAGCSGLLGAATALGTPHVVGGQSARMARDDLEAAVRELAGGARLG